MLNNVKEWKEKRNLAICKGFDPSKGEWVKQQRRLSLKHKVAFSTIRNVLREAGLIGQGVRREQS
jgi:hypothetical protein